MDSAASRMCSQCTDVLAHFADTACSYGDQIVQVFDEVILLGKTPTQRLKSKLQSNKWLYGAVMQIAGNLAALMTCCVHSELLAKVDALNERTNLLGEERQIAKVYWSEAPMLAHNTYPRLH